MINHKVNIYYVYIRTAEQPQYSFDIYPFLKNNIFNLLFLKKKYKIKQFRVKKRHTPRTV